MIEGRQRTSWAGPQPSLNVVLVVWSLRRGGAEGSMAMLANWWAEQGHRVTLVTLDAEDNDSYDLHPAIRRVSFDLMRDVGFFARWVNNLRRALLFRQTLRNVRPSAIVSFIDAMNVFVLGVTVGSSIPIVVSERIDPNVHRTTLGVSLLRRVLYRRASAIVVQTTGARSWAQRVFPSRPAVVIPNAVDVSRSSEADALAAKAPVVISLGRLDRQKGHDILLRAFATVTSRHPEWSLVIHGRGPEKAALESLIRELGISGRAQIADPTPSPETSLSRAGLFVLASRYEGFPNALLEAMACGLPVIATDCPSGPGDIVRHKIDGLLVKPDCVTNLAAAMDRLMSNALERATLGERAVEVKERFALNRVMPLWDDVLRQVSGIQATDM